MTNNPFQYPRIINILVEEIVLKGRNSSHEFDIPSDILAPAHDTREQLNMIEKVLKNKLGTLPSRAKAALAALPSNGTPKRLTPSPRPGPSREILATTPKRRLTRSPEVSVIDDTSNDTPQNIIATDDVTVILDSDDEQFNADLQLAIELSKRPKHNEPPKKEFRPSNKVKEEKKTPVPSTSTSTSNSNWLQSHRPKPTPMKAMPNTPKGRPPNPTTTSKLESKAKASAGPRLVANDLSKVERRIEDYIDVVYPKGEAIKKFEASHPYNFFLTAIVDSPATHQERLSITMQEILDDSLGELEASVQINFMVDIGWLLAHYYFAGHL